MKLKYYLNGFGTGVLFAVILLSVSFAFRPAKNISMTDTEIIARARELGMEMASKPSENPTESMSESLESSPESESEPEKDTSSGITEDTRIEIQIHSGMTAKEVAQILNEAGVIEDVDSLNEYFRQEGVENLLRAGTFEFTKGMSFEEIKVRLCD